MRTNRRARLEEGRLSSSFSALFVSRSLAHSFGSLALTSRRSPLGRRQLRQLTAACRGYREGDMWGERLSRRLFRKRRRRRKKKRKLTHVNYLAVIFFIRPLRSSLLLSKLARERKITVARGGLEGISPKCAGAPAPPVLSDSTVCGSLSGSALRARTKSGRRISIIPRYPDVNQNWRASLPSAPLLLPSPFSLFVVTRARVILRN